MIETIAPLNPMTRGEIIEMFIYWGVCKPEFWKWANTQFPDNALSDPIINKAFIDKADSMIWRDVWCYGMMNAFENSYNGLTLRNKNSNHSFDLIEISYIKTGEILFRITK